MPAVGFVCGPLIQVVWESVSMFQLEQIHEANVRAEWYVMEPVNAYDLLNNNGHKMVTIPLFIDVNFQ